jgi:hypothetical protein
VIDAEKELKAIEAFLKKIGSAEKLEGPDGVNKALENLRLAQRIELSLRTKEATERMRALRAEMARSLIAPLEEPLKTRTAKAILRGDLEVRVQMYFDFFHAIPQLPSTMVLQVGALAARGKELFLEVAKELPDDGDLAEKLRDIISYYEEEARNAAKAKH